MPYFKVLYCLYDSSHENEIDEWNIFEHSVWTHGFGSGLILSGSRKKKPDPDPALIKILHLFYDDFQLEIVSFFIFERVPRHNF